MHEARHQTIWTRERIPCELSRNDLLQKRKRLHLWSKTILLTRILLIKQHVPCLHQHEEKHKEIPSLDVTAVVTYALVKIIKYFDSNSTVSWVLNRYSLRFSWATKRRNLSLFSTFGRALHAIDAPHSAKQADSVWQDYWRSIWVVLHWICCDDRMGFCSCLSAAYFQSILFLQSWWIAFQDVSLLDWLIGWLFWLR